MDYITVTGVEVISTGMAWKGASRYYVTAEHLADMVASQADPLIRAPRLKLGHLDPRFNGGLTSHDPWNMDADPAFGTLTNLRVEQDGAMLVADLEEVPADLADALPSVFPNRSAEWVWDYETAGGRKYSAVLTDLALLGTRQQAVEDLADLVRANLPAAVAAPIVDDLLAAAAAKGVTTLPDHPSMTAEPPAATAAAGPAASVSVERIAARFNDWVITDPVQGLDTYWWWCRDVRVDPDEIIAADGDGGTYRVPFITDGEHDVTFGEPVQVRETYVDVAAASAAASAAEARHGQRVLASYQDAPAKPQRPNPAAASAGPDTEEHTMEDDVRMVLERQGLDPENATEEQINAASVFAAAGIEPPAATTDPEAEEEAVEPVAEVEAEDLVGAAATREIERLSRELQELRTSEAARTQNEQRSRRDGLASQWVREGRIAPSDHDHYRQLLDVDEQRTVALASALATGRVPVAETEAVNDEAFASLGDGPLPDNVSILTPGQRAQRAAS